MLRVTAILITLTVLALPHARAAQTKQIASYDLEVTLDPVSHRIAGHEILTWTNNSGDAVGELQFHLYMNAFKNGKSTFFRESGGQLRGDRAGSDAWGWIDVSQWRILNGPDLSKAVQFIQPDDGNRDDETVVRIPLPQPVPPGGSIQIETRFTTHLQHVFARTGYHGDYYLAGQWFPKIGVYEAAGTRYARQGQWNCHQFHANSEFYADYGTYRAQITVPSRFVVGATGVEQERRPDSRTGLTSYRFYQEDVHDFAWTASPLFQRFEHTFRADQEVTPTELAAQSKRLGLPIDQIRLSDVRIIALMQPEHAGQVERHIRALRHSIKLFGLWYGRYPHATITVVDPPYGAGASGGMEYPTFITAGTEWLIAGNQSFTPEMVTVHEFGHQFWQGLVGNNEFEEAWMDEGFNTYSTGKVLDTAYGATQLPLSVLHLPLNWFLRTPTLTYSWSIDRTGYLLARPDTDSLARWAWQYQNGGSYEINSYSRTGLMLLTLERLLGPDQMARVMRTYQQRWRYRHPAAPDFIQTVEEVSGRPWQWFFDQTVFGSDIVDYAVESVTSDPLPKLTPGLYGRAAKQTVSAEAALTAGESDRYRTRFTVRRNGTARFPVQVRVTFANGEVKREQWDGQYRWQKYEYIRSARVRSVEVDPDRQLLLDANFGNNSYQATPNPTVGLQWTSTLLFWIQNLLQLANGLL